MWSRESTIRVVFVQAWNGDGFETRAEVRRVYIGCDGQTHIGVRFLDGEPPATMFLPS